MIITLTRRSLPAPVLLVVRPGLAPQQIEDLLLTSRQSLGLTRKTCKTCLEFLLAVLELLKPRVLVIFQHIHACRQMALKLIQPVAHILFMGLVTHLEFLDISAQPL